MFVNFLILKNKEYLTEEDSCFVILTKYMNERFCRHCKFPNELPFPNLRGPSFKLGRSLKFSAVNRGAHSKGTFIYVKALFQIITVRLLLERCKNLIFTMIARKMTGIRKKENLFGITYKFN